MPGIGLARMLDDLSDEVNDRPGVSERLVAMETQMVAAAEQGQWERGLELLDEMGAA